MSEVKTREKIVLVADIARFLAFGGQVSAEKLFDIARQYYDVCDAVFARHGGVFIKGAGDAALGLFPVELSVGFDKRCADIRACLNDHFAGQGLPLTVNIAATIGPVAMGDMRAANRQWPEVFGQAVNQAFMLKGHGVLLSDPLKSPPIAAMES